MDKVKDIAVDAIISLPLESRDWADVLRKSTSCSWDGASKIRSTAIDQLECTLSSVDMILLAKECQVGDWLLTGYEQMVERDKTISEEDEERIGVSDTIKLLRIRDRLRGSRRMPHCDSCACLLEWDSDCQDKLEVRGKVRDSFEMELKAAKYSYNTPSNSLWKKKKKKMKGG